MLNSKGKLISTTAKSSSKNLRDSLYRTKFYIPKDDYVLAAVQKTVARLKEMDEYRDTDEDFLIELAAAEVCKYTEISKKGRMQKFTLNENVAEGTWSNFTYEEIIRMYEAGENVPKEVAEWAYKMANYDQLTYEVDCHATANQNDINQLNINSDDKFSDQKNNLIKSASQLEKQDEKIEEDNKKLVTKGHEISAKQQDLANKEKASQEKIEAFSKEYKEIERKINNGEELSDDEISRYKALGSMLNSEHKEIVIQSQNVEADIANLFDDMQKSAKITAMSNQLANNVQLLSESVAPQEKNANAAINLKHVVEIDSSLNNFRAATSDGKLFNLSMDLSVNTSFLADKSNLEIGNASEFKEKVDNQLEIVSNYDEVTPKEANSAESAEDEDVQNPNENIPTENVEGEQNQSAAQVQDEEPVTDEEQVADVGNNEEEPIMSEQENPESNTVVTGAAAELENMPANTLEIPSEELVEEPVADNVVPPENEIPAEDEQPAIEDISSERTEEENIQKRGNVRTAEETSEPTTINNNLKEEDKIEAKDKNLPASEQVIDETQNPQNVVYDEAISGADASIDNLSSVTDVLGDAHVNTMADMPLSDKSAMASISKSEDMTTESGAVKSVKISPKHKAQNSQLEEAGDVVSAPLKDKVEDAPAAKAEGKKVESQEIIANEAIADAVNRERKAGEEQSENNKDVIENTYELRNSAYKIKDFKNSDEKENTKLSDIDKSSKILKSEIEDNAAQQTSAPIENGSTLEQTHRRKLAKLETSGEDAKVLDHKVEDSGEQINKLGNNSDEENAKVINKASADMAVADEKRAEGITDVDNEQKLSERIDVINELYTNTKAVGREVKQNALTDSVGNVLFEAGHDGEIASDNSKEEVRLAQANLSNVSQDINNVRRSLDELDDRSSFAGDNVERGQNAGAGSNHRAGNAYIAAKATTTPENGIDVENPEFATDIGVIDDAGAIPTVADETIEVQQVVSPEISISDNDIKLVDVPNSVESEDEMPAAQEDVKASIADATTEAYTNPLIRDNRDAIYEEADAAIKDEMKVVASVDAAKTSSKAVVKADVAEIMQSSLSSVGVRAQRKDSDNDKKHKLFTQFENQKRNEARKTVQKVNKARDAR